MGPSHRWWSVGGALSLSLAALSLPLVGVEAQIPGNLDWPILADRPGVSVQGEWTRGIDEDSGEAMYAGARLVVSSSRVAVWGGAGYYGMGSGVDNDVTGGVGVAYRLAEPERGATVSLEGGAGYADVSGVGVVAVTGGVTLAFATGGPLRPFVRAHGLMARVSGRTDLGISSVGGGELRLSSGLGVFAGVQWEQIDASGALALGAGVRAGF